MRFSVTIPASEPDAGSRETEPLRRARTVFACLAGSLAGQKVKPAFHGRTLRQGVAGVVPNFKTQFGDMAA